MVLGLSLIHICIAFHGVVADVIGGVNADLCTAAVFLQGNRNVGDICFGIAA